MSNAFQTKADVGNEIRNQIYYNQLEINRLLSTPNLVSHKSTVDKIIELLKANVLNGSAIDLLEVHIPTPATKQAAAINESPAPSPDEVGVKQID